MPARSRPRGRFTKYLPRRTQRTRRSNPTATGFFLLSSASSVVGLSFLGHTPDQDSRIFFMCGICGVYPYGIGEPVGAEVLDSMLRSIRHRGPDDEGMYLDADVGLGSRRLSIIDLAGGRQPIYNEDRSIVVVFNGEIYNFEELRARLQRCGHAFTTSSDTEVIVHLYEDAGDDCVHELTGMFAFALWDIRR